MWEIVEDKTMEEEQEKMVEEVPVMLAAYLHKSRKLFLKQLLL